jgi:integrase
MVRRRKAPIRGYPAPSLIQHRGQFSVKVNIPVRLRPLFGNGSGTTTDRRISTGTSDKFLAEALKYELANKIYDEFDKRQRAFEQRHFIIADTFALDAITGLALSFKHRDIPALNETTEYKKLVSFKSSCDVYAKMILNDASDDQTEDMMALISDDILSAQQIVAKFKAISLGSSYTLKQKGLAGRYRSEVVHTFWQDLLVIASREQGLSEHRLVPFEGLSDPLVLVDNEIFPAVKILDRMAEKPLESIERVGRVTPQVVPTISSIMNGYLEDMKLKQKNRGTQAKLTRWSGKFLSVMGDVELTEIKPKHGYDYVRALLKEYPNRSNGTLKDDLWGVQNLLKYCVECGYLDANPFRGLDLSKYGAVAAETYPYSLEELKLIFAHDWEQSDRLLLSILATTGMRPSEVGNLTWERFNCTEYNFRFVSTLDTADEKVKTKNAPSKREVPLHPELWLPPIAEGRLFNYTKDKDGLSSTSIAHKINPILDQIVPHPNKSVRSFRRTFKIAMRNLGVGEEVHDAITGHGKPSASRQNYSGMSMQIKFDAIAKMDISFVQQRPF